jgi:hypothetical protein
MPAKKANPGRARDAETGKYVKKAYAEKHPKTAVVEHDRKKKSSR